MHIHNNNNSIEKAQKYEMNLDWLFLTFVKSVQYKQKNDCNTQREKAHAQRIPEEKRKKK